MASVALNPRQTAPETALAAGTRMARRRIPAGVVWPFALLAAILLFQICTIRAGHIWGDDYALYIHHAKNLATGVPYADIGYIADPGYPSYSLRVAPPGFPMILAGIYRIFGMNFTAFKVVEVVFLTGCPAMMLLLFRDELTLPWRLTLVGLMGFNPFFRVFKDNVVSDLPFCFFVLLTAVLAERQRPAWQTGVSAYLALATRTIGVLLLPAIVLHDLIRNKRITRYSILAVACCTVLGVSQRLILHADASDSYIDLFRPSVHVSLTNIRNYSFCFAQFWSTPFFWMTALICGATILLAIRGIAGRQPVFLALFSVPYGVALLLWPGASQETRYLIPLFVLFLFYVMRGMERWGWKLSAAACALFLLGYTLEYRGQNFGAIDEANGRPTFMAMCSWVTNHTAPDDRFVFNRARTLSLFTDRPASPYHRPAHPNSLWTWFHAQNIQYVIASRLFERDRAVLTPIMERHRAEVEPAYRNADFTVYRIAGTAAAERPSP